MEVAVHAEVVFLTHQSKVRVADRVDCGVELSDDLLVVDRLMHHVLERPQLDSQTAAVLGLVQVVADQVVELHQLLKQPTRLPVRVLPQVRPLLLS